MGIRQINLDKVGACASAVCAIHCLLTGFALGLLSVVGLGFFGNPIVDGLFLGVAVLVGFIALIHGVRQHKSYVPALFFIVGLLAMGIGHFGGHDRNAFTAILSVTGGVCLVLFHILNLRLQRAKTCCGEGKICTHRVPATEEQTAS